MDGFSGSSGRPACGDSDEVRVRVGDAAAPAKRGDTARAPNIAPPPQEEQR